MARIAMIGAGSMVFCKTLVHDILATEALRDNEICLMNHTRPKLDRMEAFVKRMVKDNGLSAKVTATTDRARALEGADYIIIMIQVGGQSFNFKGQSWDQWRAMGRDEGSVIADPKFVDPEKRDFRFASNETIQKTGFVPFDYSQAGVYGDADWIALAKATPNSNKENNHDKPR